MNVRDWSLEKESVAQNGIGGGRANVYAMSPCRNGRRGFWAGLWLWGC